MNGEQETRAPGSAGQGAPGEESEESMASVLVKGLLGGGEQAKLLDDVFRKAGTSTSLIRQLRRYYTHHPDFSYKEVDAETGEDISTARRKARWADGWSKPAVEARRVYQKPEHEALFANLDKLVELADKRDETLGELLRAAMFEKEMQGIGLTRAQVSHYIRAENKKFAEGGRYRRLSKEDPGAIVGVVDVDQKEHFFKTPILTSAQRMKPVR